MTDRALLVLVEHFFNIGKAVFLLRTITTRARRDGGTECTTTRGRQDGLTQAIRLCHELGLHLLLQIRCGGTIVVVERRSSAMTTHHVEIDRHGRSRVTHVHLFGYFQGKVRNVRQAVLESAYIGPIFSVLGYEHVFNCWVFVGAQGTKKQKE